MMCFNRCLICGRRTNHEARLAAAERVVEAARDGQSFMPDRCEHADAFQPHPENIWCAARHRHAIVDALIAYDAADLNSADPMCGIHGSGHLYDSPACELEKARERRAADARFTNRGGNDK